MAQTSKKKPTPQYKAKPKKNGKAGSTDKMRSLLQMEGIKSFFQGDSLLFISGLLLFLVALFMLIAFISQTLTGSVDQSAVENIKGWPDDVVAANYGGRLGAYTSYYFMNECFGFGAFFIPVFLFALSVKLMRVYKVRLWKYLINCTLLMVWVSITLSLLQNTFFPDTDLSFNPGGMHGRNVCRYLTSTIGNIPTYALVIVSAIFYLIYLSSETIAVLRKMMKPQDYLRGRFHFPWFRKKTKNEEPLEDNAEDAPVYRVEGGEEEEEEEEEEPHEEYTVSLNFETDAKSEKSPSLNLDPNTSNTTFSVEVAEGTDKDDVMGHHEKKDVLSPEDVANLEPYDPCLDLENYQKPGTDLLKKYADTAPSVDMAEQNANKDRIITALSNFGVQLTSIKATVGPTITLYEITLAPGVKISKVRNLEDDIALSLSALGIRIIAPIPGKGTVGIEVPNKNQRIVSMESIINSKKFQESTYELPIAIGKTITNEVFMVDLAKMPHLLVAGATGQGKSVGLNAIITSLLYKKHPSELKIVMVDPKKVEFSVYTPIENHFLAMIPEEDDPIITDVTKVVQTLKSLCQLMDHRYDLLKKAKVRNIKEYNAKFKARQLNPENGHEFMPYIVIIIDEFGDLIMTAGKEVELPIARIAQLARAVGMHMVIATQRPTTNIITGTIKANFPARMAFKVMSRVDSQTILDQTGANQLIGRGDLLFLSGNEPVRVQCAFVDTPEVENICNYIAEQQGFPHAYELPEVTEECSSGNAGGGAAEMEAIDPMFKEAARLIVIHQSGSTSLIQRKFSIGYNRAGRLMDQMERAGIVGPSQGAKPRKVLCADEIELEAKFNMLGEQL